MALSDAFRPGATLIGTRLRLLIGAATACLAFLALSQRPLTAPLPDRIEIAELSWVEVRTLLDHGFTTAIVPSGGLEQNGPHLAIGKHDRIVAYTARRIAAGLGRALV
ncbi:MAG: creatininase family protein, partial [Enterovirga sp.]|nr:creatininase family protein [Enterovirga sp.]